MASKTPKNILIPVDFSQHSARALAYGIALAERVGASVVAIHVVRPAFEYIPLEEAVWGSTLDARALTERLRDNATKQFEAFLQEAPKSGASEVSHEIDFGEPAETVLDRAQGGEIDLIVVGSHGRKGVARWVMGSVAERIVRHAECPVLVVH